MRFARSDQRLTGGDELDELRVDALEGAASFRVAH